jgi:CheY-like chemotaxis protein
VNVSGRQLQRPGFVQDVAEALSASGLPAGRLVLEVTESVLLADLDGALHRLEALRALGVQLALDDFGTGYSSLAYLQRLPVDVLKVDRSFTAEVLTDPKRAAVVRAVVGLAGTLGLRVVAEGIETAEQWAALRAMDCAYGQGYYFARPAPGRGPARLPGHGRSGPQAASPADPPVAVAGAPTGAPTASPARADTVTAGPSAPLVLVADDDAQVRTLIARTLAAAGFAVSQAVDGADALRHLAAAGGEVALVVTDLAMPELDGAALARALARRVPALPVLVVSGQASDGCLAALPDGAAVRFLPKPFTRAALLDAVHGLLAPAGVPSVSGCPG